MMKNYKINKHDGLWKFILIAFIVIIILLILFPPKHQNNVVSPKIDNINPNNNFYTEIPVDTCNLSGKRESMAKVDIGVDTDTITRNYFGYTNHNGQLIKVDAEQLFLQTKEEEKHKGRYCKDEAKVPGTENEKYDQGHVIADSLGGASNAYNITPEVAQVNRKGGQQYNLEQEFIKILKEGGSITNLVVLITYPDEHTMTPSSYEFRWVQNASSRSLIIDNR